jgi:serine/threonine protein kinase
VGQVLADRFEIQKMIGVGGMGRVYLAMDQVLERPVAVKVLREVLGRDTGSVRRLVEEAKASIRLAHPNIVRVDDYHDAGTVKFLAMEYVEGETLADRLGREGKLTEAETRRIALELCKGLEHAHANRVIHRDLKPANVLLGKNGSVKITDFGIARVARDSVSRLTSQQDSGTLLYMSPEQLSGKSDEVSDIYSLGVVFYEMLSGEPPFQSGDIPYQIREVMPDAPHGISSALSSIVMKCLQKKPELRFHSITELREELERKPEQRIEEEQRRANEAEEQHRQQERQEKGKGLVAEGRRAFDQGNYSVAMAKLEEAQKLGHTEPDIEASIHGARQKLADEEARRQREKRQQQARSPAAAGGKYPGAKTVRRTSASAIVVLGILILAPFTFFPQVQIEPSNFTINVGESKQLVAHVSGSWYKAVSWSCDVGRISQNGWYTAPPFGYPLGVTFKVRATSRINPHRYVEAVGIIPGLKLPDIHLRQKVEDFLKK